MKDIEVFSADYVKAASTTGSTNKPSEVKALLKNSTNAEQMSIYGTSKPKRVVIKARITNG